MLKKGKTGNWISGFGAMPYKGLKMRFYRQGTRLWPTTCDTIAHRSKTELNDILSVSDLPNRVKIIKMVFL